jgi:hypothetical protein
VAKYTGANNLCGDPFCQREEEKEGDYYEDLDDWILSVGVSKGRQGLRVRTAGLMVLYKTTGHGSWLEYIGK